MGTMSPRMLMTPFTYEGGLGMGMGLLHPRISCTRRMSTPYSSPFTMNVSNCSLLVDLLSVAPGVCSLMVRSFHTVASREVAGAAAAGPTDRSAHPSIIDSFTRHRKYRKQATST